MITIDGKTYRTLPEQVEENTRNIASIEDNIDVLETAIGRTIITTEQLDERIDALDNELIQGLADIDLQIIDINARIDAVDEKADTNAEDIAGLKTEDANIRGSISELRNVVNGSAQYLIETMEDVDKIKNTKLYRHNVLLYYRHVNPELTQVGSDGHFQIAFTLINNDSKSYSFKHNATGTTPTIMGLDEAWQSLRLYRALPQNTRDENSSYIPGTGSALVCEGTSAPLKVSPCIVNYLLGTYYNANGNWERIFKIHSSKVDGSTIAGAVIQVKCGHPTFDADGNETSLWTTKEEFEANEYNTYASYFCQNRIHCIDTVEELIDYDSN